MFFGLSKNFRMRLSIFQLDTRGFFLSDRSHTSGKVTLKVTTRNKRGVYDVDGYDDSESS